VHRGQRLAVHLVGEEHLRLLRLVERDRAAEIETAAVPFCLVQTGELDVPGVRLRAGGVQDLAQRHAPPLGGADGLRAPAELTGDVLDRHHLAPPVAGALERRRQSDARQAAQLFQRNAERLADAAFDGQPESGLVDLRHGAMVADEEEIGGGQLAAAEQEMRRRPGIEWLFLADQDLRVLAVRCGRRSVHAVYSRARRWRR